MTRAVITITFEGEQLSLEEAAKRSGIAACCLRKRYQKGWRGDDLFRPNYRGAKAEKQAACGHDDLRAKRETRESVERTKLEQRLARQRRERESKARIAAEHAAAFSRPLIDSSLLTAADRAANRDRVKYCGQKCWSLKGLG